MHWLSRQISQLAGEHEVPARSLTRGAQVGQTSTTAATVWRPRLPVSAIRGVPPGKAVLLYHTSDPAIVCMRPAHRTGLWLRAARPVSHGSPEVSGVVGNVGSLFRRWRRG